MPNYISPNPETGKAFYQQFQGKGKIVMLNLLRFKDKADYAQYPQLKPEGELSGLEAYELYMKHTAPLLQEAGAKPLFFGAAKAFLIGPEEEKWDMVIMVQYESVEVFMAFAQNPNYLKIAGHRTAALEDSRLLPMSQTAF
ncbi:MAG: DUF1330 domain-containing protein [Bacteroidia bacterium]|nr:DUF1330 domain-containing protein [Bacteroidia bacterium]